MDNLTPTARLTLDAIRDGGPGNVHELRERTGRSRSATDKALAELAKADLIVKIDHDGGDPADGAPTRWQLADPATRADAGPTDETAADDTPAQAAPDQPGPSDPAGASEPTDPAPPGDGPPATHAVSGAAPATGEERSGADGDQAAEPEPPKLCRGCQAQMPKICQDCWQKTPSYCGTCRRTVPQVRRGEPGEPVILSNGLPKLRPGELEELVAKVLREQAVPHHVGVTGWTGGRVAVFLPGRSTGAINNALRKLAKTGVAELIGDNPERYQPKGGNATDADPDTAAGAASQLEAGQPATDGTAEAAVPKAETTQ